MKAVKGRGRRGTVSSVRRCATEIADYKKPVYPKSDSEKEKIRRVLKDNEKMKMLLGHINGQALEDIINAFHRRQFVVGDDIIRLIITIIAIHNSILTKANTYRYSCL